MGGMLKNERERERNLLTKSSLVTIRGALKRFSHHPTSGSQSWCWVVIHLVRAHPHLLLDKFFGLGGTETQGVSLQILKQICW